MTTTTHMLVWSCRQATQQRQRCRRRRRTDGVACAHGGAATGATRTIGRDAAVATDLEETATWRIAVDANPSYPSDTGDSRDHKTRSEERRVGEECRTRWAPDH